MRRILTLAIIFLTLPSVRLSAQSDSTAFDHLPFAMYSTDDGFGAGYKGVLRNSFGMRESFDLTLFLATRGERWVRLGWSLTDAELRQGTIYGLAVDIVVDYDKMMNNRFFGIGPDANYDDLEEYTYEPLEITTAFSRGFTRNFVSTVQLRFKRVWSYGFEDQSRLRNLPEHAGTADLWSAMLQLRHDTRNSVIHPSSGIVLQAEVEQAIDLTPHAFSWTRYAARVQHYTRVLGIILALRADAQSMSGDVPVQHMLSVGGNNTVRGIPKDRFLDRSSAIANTELRFPIWRRLGGIVGMDAGAVAPDLGALADSRWTVAPAAGLRLIFDTFVTRADIGVSGETVGFYLNFGHIF